MLLFLSAWRHAREDGTLTGLSKKRGRSNKTNVAAAGAGAAGRWAHASPRGLASPGVCGSGSRRCVLEPAERRYVPVLSADDVPRARGCHGCAGAAGQR